MKSLSLLFKSFLMRTEVEVAFLEGAVVLEPREAVVEERLIEEQMELGGCA